MKQLEFKDTMEARREEVRQQEVTGKLPRVILGSLLNDF